MGNDIIGTFCEKCKRVACNCKAIRELFNKPKKLLIEFEDWHHQCGDGCCDMYGTDIFLNGEKLDTQYAEDSKNALKAVLEKLGYEVEFDRK